jgi:hypothetical protein
MRAMTGTSTKVAPTAGTGRIDRGNGKGPRQIQASLSNASREHSGNRARVSFSNVGLAPASL